MTPREGTTPWEGGVVTAELIAQARAGDGDAFRRLTEPHRRELHVHCYRILGSYQDAEDVLQETLLSAWRGLGGYEERASVRTWLYRIATNRSLDALRAGARRDGAMTQRTERINTERINGVEPPAPSAYSEVPWLQPYPDELVDLPDPAPGPEAVVEQHEAMSLAFVTALQLLPPRQRAVLLLRDVLGYRAAEAAEILETTVESVTSALKRARATIDADATLAERRTQAPAPEIGSAEERRLVAAYVDAFSTHDVDKLLTILSDDVWLKMPPLPFEYHGRDEAIGFFEAIVHPQARRMRMVHTRANGCPASGMYAHDAVTDTWRATGLIVLVFAGDRICEITRFEPAVMASFGLPRTLA
jgi:RNA polymerase sigma-70 factor (ECF subfamily)